MTDWSLKGQRQKNFGFKIESGEWIPINYKKVK